MLDNPSLTTRLWPGRNPLRLVIDREATLGMSLKLFDGTTKTIVFTDVFRDFEDRANIEQVSLDFTRDILPQMMDYLYAHKVQRLLVEGGAMLLQSFIDAGLWDEAFVEETPCILGGGVEAPRLKDDSRKEQFTCFGHQISHFLH
jgi:diaminohydroxyphosphoribosylaminopyrimidine deaminase/5-amino-6-(5-phosphoribosylamino)uracil reductase